MFKCHICGSTDSNAALVTEVFNLNDRFYLVENVPATVCTHCGEEIFSRETTENIRAMLHGQAQPQRWAHPDVGGDPPYPPY